MGNGVEGARPGDVIAGKFRVERLIGEGGMGCVVAATHLELDELVAIKVLLPEATTEDATARFLREAKAAVRLKGDHVVRVSDIGRLESGAPYMVMEYLEGRDLDQLLQVSGPLSPEAACDYFLQACDAIAAAHAVGIVHRDLKPANLFLIRRPNGSPCIKVLDFGISKVSGKGFEANMTKTTAAMGTPLYMSPEQMASARNVDARTDIWALGVILYQLLTARLPFEAESLPELCVKVLQTHPIPVTQLAPGVNPQLEWIVMRCVEKDPARRFQTIVELVAALATFAPNHPTVTSLQAANPGRTSAFPRSTPPPPMQPTPGSGMSISGNVVPQTGSTTGPGVAHSGSTPPPMGASTSAAWQQRTNGSAKGSGGAVAIAVLATVLLGGAVGGVVWWRASRASTATAAAASPAAPSESAGPSEPTPAPAAPSAAAPPEAQTAAATAAPAPTATAAATGGQVVASAPSTGPAKRPVAGGASKPAVTPKKPGKGTDAFNDRTW